MPFRVLLIEDNPGDVVIARAALLESGFPIELCVARDGVDGVRFLKKTAGFENALTPALIILDWRLPFRPGSSVLKEIKYDEAIGRIPVVIYSASDAPADVKRAYNMGGNCWVRKGWNLSEQFQALTDIMWFWSNVASQSKPLDQHAPTAC